MPGVARREFLTLLGGAGASVALAGCGGPRFDERYTEGEAAALVRQQETERAQTGRGPFGPQRYRGYRGLAELPWFELDAQGRLRLAADDVPRAIDLHCHFGTSLLFAPDLDLLARTPRVQHLLDCDGEDPGCWLDLDVYINGNFTEENLSTMRSGLVRGAFFGNPAAKTQTLPNLLEEMDASGVERAVILPIVFGLPFGDDAPAQWRAAIEAAGAGARLQPGASVHPEDPERIAKLEAQAAAGARIVKLHPTVQRFYPDAPEMMELYAACERLGLAVFFHCGRAGIEPESTHRYALPRHYEGALASFPKVEFVLGHGGARDGPGALELALRYENAWPDLHGQGVTFLNEMLRRTGGERAVFGSDWPFYHLAATLAKVLIVTEGDPELRYRVLRGNAERLLG